MRTSLSSVRSFTWLLCANLLLAVSGVVMPTPDAFAHTGESTAKAATDCDAILAKIRSVTRALKKAKRSTSPQKAKIIRNLSKKLRGLKKQLALCKAATAPLPPFVDIEFVAVGNVANPDDSVDADAHTSGVQVFGGVAHEYQIGKYEVSVEQYASFLNAVAKADTFGLYNVDMAADAQISGIQRSGSPGSYRYTVIGSGKKPVSYVNWLDAARFCNWLHNQRPDGAQDDSTTETGVYDLDGANVELLYTRQPGATFWIPTADEWYKAAFHHPNGAGGPVDHYWLYATTSDSAPGNQIGATANQANYYDGDYSVTQNASLVPGQNYLTDGGSYTGSASFYGTFDQGGNVREWTEDVVYTTNRTYWGGAFDDNAGRISSSGGMNGLLPEAERYDTGFRVATLPPAP